jgi:capsule polysaccharide modification protein KpsS
VAGHDGMTPAFRNLNEEIVIKNERVEYINNKNPLQRGFVTKLFKIKDTSFYNVFLKELPFIFNRFDKLHPTYPNALLFQLLLFYEQIKRIFRREYGCYISDVKKAKLESERIILYPEHFHPEASYSATNFELRNDFENILNIASNLPSDCKLVVKLHPSNSGRVSTSLYRDIENSTGVIFLRSDQSLDEFLTITNLIVSINSTVVIDAAKLGVPSILIGEMEVTEGCVGVKRITSFSEIKSVLNDQVLANAYLNEDWFASHYLDVYLWSEDFADRFYDAICDESKHVAQV